MADAYFVYVIAAMSITFGFIALLRQKTYIIEDPEKPGDSRTEIELPFMSKVLKLKTNYPSLLFVLVGFVLTWTAAAKVPESGPCEPSPPKKWKISGTLTHSGGDAINWEQGTLAVHPTDIVINGPNEFGRFEIWVDIDSDKTFEKGIESITYTNGPFSKAIIPADEMKKFEAEDPGTLIQSATDTERKYKPVTLDSFPEETRVQ